MSTLKVTNIQSNGAGFNDVVSFQNASGTQNGTLCRTWVNFNGTGTVAIRASFNVSSITDNGTGQYTVNFATAMADANYSTLVTSSVNANTSDSAMNSNFVTTSSVRVASMTASGAFADSSAVNVAIFR
jgi:hypothetical protein